MLVFNFIKGVLVTSYTLDFQVIGSIESCTLYNEMSVKFTKSHIFYA